MEIISEECGDSPKQVQRYISLTKLIPEFLQKLDDELISFNPAVEISALKEEQQKQLLEAMDYAQAVPSLSQAQRIKKLSKENQLTLEKMQEIMSEIKKGEITRVAFTNAAREEKEHSAVEKVKSAYSEKYDPMLMHDSKHSKSRTKRNVETVGNDKISAGVHLERCTLFPKNNLLIM